MSHTSPLFIRIFFWFLMCIHEVAEPSPQIFTGTIEESAEHDGECSEDNIGKVRSKQRCSFPYRGELPLR